MTQDERLVAISHHIQEHGRMSVEEICERFGVSRDTARRDLVRLEEERRIIRTRGGAVRPALANETQRYEERTLHAAAKQAVGRAAAALVQDGEHLLLDASTTVQGAAEALRARNVVAVTTAIDVAESLGRKEGVTVHLLGGQFNPWHRSVTGVQTLHQLQEYRVHTLFLGACGLSADGLSSPDPDEAFVKRAMLARAGRVVVLADGSKLGKALFHRVCAWDEVDMLVIDQPPAGDLREALLRHDVKVIIASGGTADHDD